MDKKAPLSVFCIQQSSVFIFSCFSRPLPDVAGEVREYTEGLLWRRHNNDNRAANHAPGPATAFLAT